MRRNFRSTIKELDIHPSARKHGISDTDIKHVVDNAMTAYDQEDDLRLYLGAASNADLIEVVTVVRGSGREMAVHAMKMRRKYRRFLPGE